MVEVRYRDRLGNNLFQYALGRIIAEELGYHLQAGPLEGFPGTKDQIAGARFSSKAHEFGGQFIDLAALLSDHSDRRIVLNGWFQRQEYYLPYRSRIRQWFRLSPEHEVACEADLVVNIRRTDYIHLGWALPFSFYREAIERGLPKGGRLVIITDDPDDVFFWRFRQWKPTFFRGTPLQQISYMTRAQRLVMSASTFSWWPAFLGNHELIVCPVPSYGLWGPESGHNVNLIDRDRFTCLPCRKPDVLNWAGIIQQRLRRFRYRATKQINQRLHVELPVVDRIMPPPSGQ